MTSPDTKPRAGRAWLALTLLLLVFSGKANAAPSCVMALTEFEQKWGRQTNSLSRKRQARAVEVWNTIVPPRTFDRFDEVRILHLSTYSLYIYVRKGVVCGTIFVEDGRP